MCYWNSHRHIIFPLLSKRYNSQSEGTKRAKILSVLRLEKIKNDNTFSLYIEFTKIIGNAFSTLPVR